MNTEQNPIETVIDGYKAFSTMLDSPAQRAGAMMTAQQAQAELDRLNRVIEGQAETIKQLEAEIKELKAAK